MWEAQGENSLCFLSEHPWQLNSANLNSYKQTLKCKKRRWGCYFYSQRFIPVPFPAIHLLIGHNGVKWQNIYSQSYLQWHIWNTNASENNSWRLKQSCCLSVCVYRGTLSGKVRKPCLNLMNCAALRFKIKYLSVCRYGDKRRNWFSLMWGQSVTFMFHMKSLTALMYASTSPCRPCPASRSPTRTSPPGMRSTPPPFSNVK